MSVVAAVQSSAAEGDRAADVEVPDQAFAQDFNEALVHQAVVAYLAGARQGTHKQKSRAEVRGGGRKPWRQKRTGRARAGSIRSPIWRGGGRTFAARPKDHAVKLNRKMYRGAIRCIFSELLRQHRLRVVPAATLSLDAPKTRHLAANVAALDLSDPALDAADTRRPPNLLFLAPAIDDNLRLAARNLPRVDVCAAADVDPVRLVSHDLVLATEAALKEIGERLS